MDKLNHAAAWTEQGYSLFAEEGIEGIHVERLARILHLNKSGFYHYFGDMELFCTALLELHQTKVDHFIQEIRHINHFDPEYLNLLIKHAPMVMFQVQLTRDKKNKEFYNASEIMDQKVGAVVQKLWGDFLELPNEADVVVRYFGIIRDMFTARISFQTLNYPFLHEFAMSAKQVVTDLRLSHPAPVYNPPLMKISKTG